MSKPTTKRFSPEVRFRAVRMASDHQAEHPPQWAAISSIAGDDTLSLILSKAALLARDDGITDPVIPRQLQPREGGGTVKVRTGPDQRRPSPGRSATPGTVRVAWRQKRRAAGL